MPDAGGTVVCSKSGHGKHKLGPSEYMPTGQAKIILKNIRFQTDSN